MSLVKVASRVTHGGTAIERRAVSTLANGNFVIAAGNSFSIINKDTGLDMLTMKSWEHTETIRAVLGLADGNILLAGDRGRIMVYNSTGSTVLHKLNWSRTDQTIQTASQFTDGNIILAGSGGYYEFFTNGLVAYSAHTQWSAGSSNVILKSLSLIDGRAVLMGQNGFFTIVNSDKTSLFAAKQWANGGGSIESVAQHDSGDMILVGAAGRYARVTSQGVAVANGTLNEITCVGNGLNGNVFSGYFNGNYMESVGADITIGANLGVWDGSAYPIYAITTSGNSVLLTGNGGWIHLLSSNSSPTLTLNTTNNKTLYENDSFVIGGTTTDTDDGDALTVKYQINSGTVRNLHSAVSDGVTPIPFAKSLTYKEGVLHDGINAVTSVLSEGTPHVISVWAEDGNGGKSAVESRTFYVVPNRPPTLTIDPIAKQSDLINSNVINVNGVVGDLDNNDVKVTFQINDGEPEEIHDGAPSSFAFNIVMKDLRNGSNTVIVKASDIYDATVSKVLTFKKTHDATPVNEAIALYKISPPTGSAQEILMWIERMIGDLAITCEVSMTDDGEPENFVSLPRTNSAPKEGLQEDEFYYDALAPKKNIVVKITYNRINSAAVAAIKKISGVLN